MNEVQDMGYDETGDEQEGNTFEEKLKRRVNADFMSAKEFLYSYHKDCLEVYQQYHNAENFDSLNSSNKFPVPFMQEQIDMFVADTMDKLYFKNRPVRVIGREETDKADADAKQAMLDYQDAEDNVRPTVSKLLRDASMYRMCCAQVDYCERKKRELVRVPDQRYDPATGMVVDAERLEWQEVVAYRGAHVKRVDPMNVFFPQEKREVGDEHPIMIRSWQTKEFFYTKPYFFNQEEIKEKTGTAEQDDLLGDKRQHLGLSHNSDKTTAGQEYVEWHGMVNRNELYEYLGYDITEVDQMTGQEVPIFDAHERCWAICGIVNSQVVVRLEEYPFELGHPNIIIGVISSEEDDLLGSDIAMRIKAVQKGLQNLAGMLTANFKQAVNQQWAINQNGLIQKQDPVANLPGKIWLTNTDPNKVITALRPPGVADDIYNFIALMTDWGKNASGIKDPILGSGSPDAETLGESQIAAAQASLRLRDYLKSFEDTLVRPLYETRNQINMQFLDAPYIYRVIGESVLEWRQIEPEQIRANVDFVCESSTRETNRHVITQQILQFAQVAPLAAQLGFPVRMDKLLEQLASQGFSWSQEIVDAVLPTIRMENAGTDMNQIILQQMMMGPQMQNQGGQDASANAPTPGKELPQPGSEGEAIRRNNDRSQTEVRGLM